MSSVLLRRKKKTGEKKASFIFHTVSCVSACVCVSVFDQCVVSAHQTLHLSLCIFFSGVCWYLCMSVHLKVQH